MISIVIPLYDKEKTVGATIESVLAQDYADFELIVVNDASNDSGPAIVRQFNDSRIRLIDIPKSGVSAARNIGTKAARGEWIAYMDADDPWKPDFLRKMTEMARRFPECEVLACGYTHITGGRKEDAIIRKLRFHDVEGVMDNYFEVASCSHPPLTCSAIMMKRSAIDAVGGFPVGMRSGEDSLTFARLARRFRIAYHRGALAYKNVGEESYNTDKLTRLPEADDICGHELRQYLAENPSIPGLRQYIAAWHKGRAKLYLLRGHGREARKECLLAMHYGKRLMSIAFMLLSVLPNRLTKNVFQRYGSL